MAVQYQMFPRFMLVCRKGERRGSMFKGGGGYNLVIGLISMVEEAVTCLGSYDLIS